MALRAISAGAVLVLALAACSGGETTPAGEAAVEAPTPAAGAAEAAAPAASAPAAAEAAVPAAAELLPEEAKAVVAAAPAAAAATAAAAAEKPAPAAAAAAQVIEVAAVVTAPPAYARCASCHSAEKGGGDKLGPNLHGTFGKAAAQGSFAFSEALKGAGLKWDEATLHKWLENPRGLVPGNRMSFPGIKDAAKRQDIIDYLKQQS